jgi:hypothetical protein
MARIEGIQAKLLKDYYIKTLTEKGYVFFDNNIPLNLNIIGVRSKNRSGDRYDDTMNVFYRNADLDWIVDSYPVTTDPGAKILRKPINKKGTAILVPGQYRSTYKVDIHGGSSRYLAVCQRGGPVKVWRDVNRDSNLDMDDSSIEEGMFGINMHKHGGPNEREFVNGSSAGCQVFKNTKDFYEFLELCNKSADLYGNSFTYTLLEESDLMC